MSVEQTPVDGNNTLNLDTDLIALAMHKLTIDNTNVTDILTDCNIYLNKLNRYDIIRAAQLMDLNLVFDCLNTTDEKQLETTCGLLQKLLSVLPSNDIFTKYSVSIERSLHHPNDVVLHSVLSELGKKLIVDNNVDIQVDLACTIVDCLLSSHTHVSYKAVKCLKRFQSTAILSSFPILSKLRSILSMDAKIRTRVYDILIHWAKLAKDALALISSKGLFSNLISDITSPDVMMQMVTIQMIIPLGLQDHGFDYLNSVGIISGLYRLLNSNPNELADPSVVILSPIVLEFFTNVTQVRPHLIYTTYPKVFTVMYEVLKEGDDTSVGVVINGINCLACSWNCKIVLDINTASVICDYQGDENLDIWSIFIIELGRIATSTKTDLKAGAILAIRQILEAESGYSISDEVMLKRTQKWYKQMKCNPLKNIVHASCILPFFDLQSAGFELLLTLAEQSWGQEEISKSPEILDLVLKVSPTDPSAIKEVKRTIIDTLLKSDTSKDVFNKDILSRMRHNVEIQSDRNLNQTDEVMVDDMAM